MTEFTLKTCSELIHNITILIELTVDSLVILLLWTRFERFEKSEFGTQRKRLVVNAKHRLALDDTSYVLLKSQQ